MSTETPSPSGFHGELSNGEAVVRLVLHTFRYSPGRCLEATRENPLKSTGLAIAIASAGVSMIGRADIGVGLILSGTAVYLVGMVAEGQLIKDGIGSLASRVRQWWIGYKRR